MRSRVKYGEIAGKHEERAAHPTSTVLTSLSFVYDGDLRATGSEDKVNKPQRNVLAHSLYGAGAQADRLLQGIERKDPGECRENTATIV